MSFDGPSARLRFPMGVDWVEGWASLGRDVSRAVDLGHLALSLEQLAYESPPFG